MQDYLPAPGRGKGVLSAAILGSAAVFLSSGGVGVALPSIQSSLGSNLSGLQWVVNAQLITLAALLPIGGSLGDRFGRRRVFLIGILMFAVASLMSAFARNIGQLTALQSVQGVGSAFMVPQSLAIINVSFAERVRGRVIGLWAGISGGVSALGPWVSGWLVEHFSWPAVFFLSSLVALAALAAAVAFVPETKNPSMRRLDPLGVLCLMAGLFGIAFGLITGPSGWTAPAVLAGLTGGVGFCVLFVLLESRQLEPVVPLQIFRNPLVAGANLATLLVYAALNGITLYSVLVLQQAHGYSPSAAGLAVIPTIVCIALLSGPAGSVSDRIGPRLQMTIGPLLVSAAASLLALSGTSSDYLRHFFPGFVLLGIGMAALIAPLTKSALAVSPDLSGSASGVNNAVSRIAALLAVAVLGAIMISTFSTRMSHSLPESGLSADQQQQVLDQAGKLGGIVVPETFDGQASAEARGVVSVSLVYSYRRVMIVCAALAFGGSAISAVMIRNRSAESQ